VTNDQNRKPFQGLRDSINLLHLTLQVMAAPVEVWLRKPGTVGERYFGIAAFLSLLFMPMFFAAVEMPDPYGGALIFWCAYIVMLAVHRVARVGRKAEVHSHCMGESIFGYNVEPVVCFLVGGLLCVVSIPVGLYVVCAAFAVSFESEFIKARDRAQVRALRDARIEQENLASQFRGEQ
jgi:hypothetical protein